MTCFDKTNVLMCVDSTPEGALIGAPVHRPVSEGGNHSFHCPFIKNPAESGRGCRSSRGGSSVSLGDFKIGSTSACTALSLEMACSAERKERWKINPDVPSAST